MAVKRHEKNRIAIWSPKIKREIKKDEKGSKGFAKFGILLGAFVVVSGILYLYSINASAVKGYQIRQIEKDISELKKENDRLKIREAQLKSLRKIEESSRNVNMGDAKNISYLEETGPLALR